MNDNENQNNQEQIQCQKCNQSPDNYISLNCGHNFCLNCLAIEYLQLKYGNEESKDQTRSPPINCEICLMSTDLDQQSVEALEQVLLEIIEQQDSNDQNVNVANLQNSFKQKINEVQESSNKQRDQKKQKQNQISSAIKEKYNNISFQTFSDSASNQKYHRTNNKLLNQISIELNSKDQMVVKRIQDNDQQNINILMKELQQKLNSQQKILETIENHKKIIISIEKQYQQKTQWMKNQIINSVEKEYQSRSQIIEEFSLKYQNKYNDLYQNISELMKEIQNAIQESFIETDNLKKAQIIRIQLQPLLTKIDALEKKFEQLIGNATPFDLEKLIKQQFEHDVNKVKGLFDQILEIIKVRKSNIENNNYYEFSFKAQNKNKESIKFKESFVKKQQPSAIMQLQNNINTLKRVQTPTNNSNYNPCMGSGKPPYHRSIQSILNQNRLVYPYLMDIAQNQPKTFLQNNSQSQRNMSPIKIFQFGTKYQWQNNIKYRQNRLNSQFERCMTEGSTTNKSLISGKKNAQSTKNISPFSFNPVSQNFNIYDNYINYNLHSGKKLVKKKFMSWLNQSNLQRKLQKQHEAFQTTRLNISFSKIKI